MSRVDRDCMRVMRATAPFDLSATLVESRPWASALFTGQRMMMVVQAEDDALLDEWLIGLPEAELSWPGYFVASAEVVERSAMTANVELLVVED